MILVLKYLIVIHHLNNDNRFDIFVFESFNDSSMSYNLIVLLSMLADNVIHDCSTDVNLLL